MRRRGLLLALGLMLTAGPAGALAQSEAPNCAAEEVAQFDFWVGSWTLSWGEDGRGTNEIARILDGCVVEERFEGHMADGRVLRGRSVTTYDAAADQWKQTWVDNQGAYLDFVGGLQDDGPMVLRREATRDGQRFLQRMVWRDVEEDRMRWTWERSTDEGASWTTVWEIHYERAD